MIRRGKLKNKINYVIENIDCFDTITIAIVFRTGSKNDPYPYYGLSHMIEHLFFNNFKFGDIYRYGGNINAVTDRDIIAFYVKVNHIYFEKILPVIAGIIFGLELTDGDIAREKAIVINELERDNSDPVRYLDSVINKMTFLTKEMQHEIGGEPKYIRKIDGAVIDAYLRKYFCDCRNITISVAGKGSATRVISLLEKYFGGAVMDFGIDVGKGTGKDKDKGKGKLPRIITKKQNSSRITIKNIKKYNLEQTYVEMAILSWNISEIKGYHLDIFNVILAGNLNSRLSVKLRTELGLVYSIKGINIKYESAGIWKIHFSCIKDSGVVKKCIEIILAEMDRLIADGVSDDEIAMAREYIISQINGERENNKNIAFFNAIYPVSYPKYLANYRSPAINRKSIGNIAREIFARHINIAILE